MSLLTVLAKEFRENLRDRRTLTSALIFGPLFGPLMFGLILTMMVKQGITETEQPLDLAVSFSERAPNLVAHLRQHAIDVKPVELDDAGAREAVRTRTHKLVLLIPEDYGTQLAAARPAPLLLYADSSDNRSNRDAQRVRRVIAGHGARISQLRLVARGVDPLTTQAIAINNVDVATPASRAALALGALSYIILLTMVMGGMYLAIDATAGERERGSLEPLLTTPVRRDHLIYGKILAASAYMVISLCLSVTALAVVLQFVGLEGLGMSANFGPMIAVKVVLASLPLVPLAAAFMTIVAAFTRTYREAQTYVGFMILVPTLPLLFASFQGVRPSALLMAVPSLSQHFLITSLLRDETLPFTYVLTSVVVTLVCGAILAAIAGQLYRREALLG